MALSTHTIQSYTQERAVPPPDWTREGNEKNYNMNVCREFYYKTSAGVVTGFFKKACVCAIF